MLDVHLQSAVQVKDRLHLLPANCFSNTHFPDVIQSRTGSRWKLTHRYKAMLGTEYVPDNGSHKLTRCTRDRKLVLWWCLCESYALVTYLHHTECGL